MCGLVGMVALNGTPLAEADLALVRRMNATQTHRGPDDSGEVLAGEACLGSTRLSIVDLSDAGHMPMGDGLEDLWIAYNGEVYNHARLRVELEGLGHRFKSRTDTEVVLHAFQEWGAECVHRFSGMFAFAVWNGKTRELTLARDRLGIKPLYYSRTDERFVFGSEIKSVLLAVERPTLDVHGLIEWSLYQSVDAPSPGTLLSEVSSVMPGEILTVRQGQIEKRIWYSPPARVRREEMSRLEGLPAEVVTREVENVVASAVSERLMSDVPVGTLLSGGLDSSLITALAAAERPITGFNVSIEGHPDLDELRHARAVAKHLDVELVTHSLTAERFRRDLPRAIALSDLPLTHANSVAYLQICETARAHGTIVLLSGEGADELFGGYTWRYRRHRNMLRMLRWLGRLPKKVRTALELTGLASAGLPVESRRFDQLLPQTIQFADRFARRDWSLQCKEAYDFVDDAIDRSTLGTMLSDLGDFLTPLLRRLDHMSMGASVECRVPFLDHRVVELGMQLPLAYRVGKRADKWVLKQVAKRHLPRALVDRKKMGFPLPLAEYLAPFARPEFFAGGFWLEIAQLRQRGLEESISTWREKPFAFLALVSGELWGRMTFMGETVDGLHGRIEELEHEPSS
jgi:asparagine synthase (glutamine-hydrolysing)